MPELGYCGAWMCVSCLSAYTYVKIMMMMKKKLTNKPGEEKLVPLLPCANHLRDLSAQSQLLRQGVHVSISW